MFCVYVTGVLCIVKPEFFSRLLPAQDLALQSCNYVFNIVSTENNITAIWGLRMIYDSIDNLHWLSTHIPSYFSYMFPYFRGLLHMDQYNSLLPLMIWCWISAASVPTHSKYLLVLSYNENYEHLVTP